MNQSGIDMINLLEALDWFNAVGQSTPATVSRVISWQEANQSCATVYWNDALLDARSDMTRVLDRDFPDDYQMIGSVVDGMKERVDRLIEAKTMPVINTYNLTKSFRSTVIWSIWNIILSAHYAHLYPSTFYADLTYWYLKGHFPCGWEGEYPKGHLIIY